MITEVLDERIDQLRNRVLPGHHGRRDVELLRRFRGDRPDRGHDGGAQQIGRLLAAEDLDEVPDRGRARERDRVDLPVEQHAVDVLVGIAVRAREQRAIGDDLHHVGAGGAQLVGQQFARDVGARKQDAHPLQPRVEPRERRHDRFRAVLFRRQIDPDAVPRDA
jgi:hypothetical protein